MSVLICRILCADTSGRVV